LEEALARYHGDNMARENLGGLLKQDGQPGAALKEFQAVLARDPNRESALFGAAACCQDNNDLEGALDYYRKVVAVNPWNPAYQTNLAVLLDIKGDRPGAKKVVDAWLKLEPESVKARSLLVKSLLLDGDVAAAKAAFLKIRDLDPPDLGALEAWFESQLRAAKTKP
jgi:Flp pilus assembly protein TadD